MSDSSDDGLDPEGKAVSTSLNMLKRGRPRRELSTLTAAGKSKRLQRDKRMWLNTGRVNEVVEALEEVGEVIESEVVEDEADIAVETEDTWSIILSDDEQLEVQRVVRNHNSLDSSLFTPNVNPIVTAHLKKSLNAIVTRNNITREATNSILSLLHDFFPKIPVDMRTLCSTPRTIEKRFVNPGYYVHIGIARNLKLIVNQIADHPTEVLMDVFADGVAFHKVGKYKSYWLILGRFKASKKVFCIGIYNGVNQPKSFNDLLKDFVAESTVLVNDGLLVGSKMYYLKLRNFIGDSIAQADIAYIKHPTGKYSCPYCQIKGQTVNNRMTFCDLHSASRTDDDYRLRTFPEHHKGEEGSELFSTLMNFPSSSPIDYLHNTLLGATKRLLTIIFGKTGPKKSNGLLNAAQKTQLQEHLNKINKYLPTEIHRDCRNISDLASYKGADFRVFLLKIGPSLLSSLPFPDEYYIFLLLHCAITLLCDPEECLLNYELAKALLKEFINEGASFFEEQFVVSVIHRLIHLPDIVIQQGKPLDSFSAFPFESYIATVKKDIHSPRNVIQQIYNRRCESVSANNDYFNEPEEVIFRPGKREKESPNCFKSVLFKNFIIKPKSHRDGFLLTNQKKVVLCQSIREENNQIIFICKELIPLPPLFTRPLISTKLNHFLCENNFDPATAVLSLRIDELERKMFCIPHNDTSYAFAPL